MLSILLPSYDTDARELVLELISQAGDMSYEIILSDDDPESSAFAQMENLVTPAHFRAVKQASNLGRSANRNWLARQAKYDWLVFIDADSLVIKEDFIASYLEAMKEADWIYGGTSYPSNAPDGCELHWNYGKQLEALDLSTRSRVGAAAFRSNNFAIKKSLWKSYPFDEELKRYGHEDTLFAHRLNLAGIKCHHIDNPVLHDELYPDEEYLARVKESVLHLAELTKAEKITNHTRLQKMHRRTDLPVIRHLVGRWLSANKESWRQTILSSSDLRALSLYKWSVYTEEMGK